MNDQPYYYTVLKYRPSYLLDEQVNVGLLFVFPQEKRAKFLFPSRLSRLKILFPTANLGFIRQYLEAFEAQAVRADTPFSTEQELQDFLESKFLVPDATAFYFSDWKTGYHYDWQALLEYYRGLYFSTFEESLEAVTV